MHASTKDPGHPHPTSSKSSWWTLSPELYAKFAWLALIALALIVLTGTAVRLTGSGLGCPDWPQCYGKATPPLETHAVIEYGNRLLSGFVGLAAAGAFFLAFLRRPFRRDLAWLSFCLPMGVVAQAVLGGFTVRSHLAPGFVMGHYGLSMVILAAAAALAHRARPPRYIDRGNPRGLKFATRGVLLLGAATVFLGTAATAAGPHAGGSGTGDEIHRLTWFGAGTLDWAIHQHGRVATLLGLAVAVSYWYIRRQEVVEGELKRVVRLSLVLVGVQGGVGIAQYLLELPAEIVWVHVGLATVTWITLLWAVAVTGGSRMPTGSDITARALENGAAIRGHRLQKTPPAGVESIGS